MSEQLNFRGMERMALAFLMGTCLSMAPVTGFGEKTSDKESKVNQWQLLFDGKTLAGWEPTDFAGHGAVRVEDGSIILETGIALTGINWTNKSPRTDYEVEIEAMRVDGNDFFCGLTVPVEDSHCTFVVGGWGGTVVGISSIDGFDASENETARYMRFEPGKWYKIRFRVTKNRLAGWINEEEMVNIPLADRRISMRPGEIELSVPFGIASYQTTAALRKIRLRQLPSGKELK